jgi:SAM-dependent methyltransferase
MLRTMRRVKQLSYLLTSSVFSDHRAIQALVKERYDSEAEVRHYLAISDEGLYTEEESVVREFLKLRRFSYPIECRALVVGCGAGREVFALEKMGLNVKGIDLSEKMIACAKKVSAQRMGKATPTREIQAEFETTDLEGFCAPNGSFDLVFVSSAIAEHIRGRDARIRFYSKARALITDRGGIYVGPEIQRVSLVSPYFWASQVLRLRWRLKQEKWEPGDSARAFFGKHNRDLGLVFYHFYPSLIQFKDEISNAGLDIVSHHEGGYLLRATDKV